MLVSNKLPMELKESTVPGLRVVSAGLMVASPGILNSIDGEYWGQTTGMSTKWYKNNPPDPKEPRGSQTPDPPPFLSSSPTSSEVRTVPSITSSRNNILHLKQSCKRLSLRQRCSAVTLPIRIPDKGTARWRGPYHKSLTSVDGPRATAGVEVELGRDVCVHPVPFARYSCVGVVWARVGGLLMLAGEVGLECSGYR